MTRGERWTDAEVEAVIEELAKPQPNLTRLAARLGRTACAVYQRAHKLRRAGALMLGHEEAPTVRLAVTERCVQCRRTLACGSQALEVGPGAYQCAGRCRE